MRMTQTIIIIFLLAAWAITICLFRNYNGLKDVELLSHVKAPVRFALREIADDMERGEHETARKKLTILQNKWDEFHAARGIGNSFSNLMNDLKSANPTAENNQ